MRRSSFNLPNHAHYLTFSCYQQQQLLVDDTLRLQLLKCWDDARRKGNYAIWAYVIMPEHIHPLVWPKSEEYEMAFILRSLKEAFSRWVIKYWSVHSPSKLEYLRARPRSRPHQQTAAAYHSFWQKGGGFDRNLFQWKAITRAMEYIEHNPVRRGLVSDPLEWNWSSARSRLGDQDVPFAVDRICVGADEK